MADYNFPDNNESTLYLDMEHRNNYTFVAIMEAAKEHFGQDVDQYDLSFAAENIKVTGCSCHSSMDDYNLYLVVTLNSVTRT